MLGREPEALLCSCYIFSGRYLNSNFELSYGLRRLSDAKKLFWSSYNMFEVGNTENKKIFESFMVKKNEKLVSSSKTDTNNTDTLYCPFICNRTIFSSCSHNSNASESLWRVFYTFMSKYSRTLFCCIFDFGKGIWLFNDLLKFLHY